MSKLEEEVKEMFQDIRNRMVEERLNGYKYAAAYTLKQLREMSEPFVSKTVKTGMHEYCIEPASKFRAIEQADRNVYYEQNKAFKKSQALNKIYSELHQLGIPKVKRYSVEEELERMQINYYMKQVYHQMMAEYWNKPRVISGKDVLQ
jgi:hypothetical protein